MDALLEAIQNVVTADQETEVQPDPTQSNDGTIETQLTEEINTLWSDHVRLSADRKATVMELRQIRGRLAARLTAMKTLLSRPGRGGQWRSWLRERGIPRSTADGLVARYAKTTSADDGNVPGRAISEPGAADAEKLAKNVWLRIGKLLITDESVIQFIDRIAELAGLGHEQRAEGLVIFIPVPEVTNESSGSARVIDPAPPVSDEVSVIAEEPALAPVQDGQAVAAADASNGDAA